MQDVAEREEKIRDLRKQVSELDKQAEEEVLFQEISPRRRRVTLYSTVDGEPTPVPEYMVRAAINATRPDGKPRFVSRKEDAPEYKLGDVKCFLHPESPERPILAEIGLVASSCPAEHLASGHAKRIHAQHRHKQEWAAVQEYLKAQKNAEYEERQKQQLEATLEIARAASSQAIPARPVTVQCQNCGKDIEGELANHECE